MIEIGQVVEYACHPVSWQKDGTHEPIEEENWATAEVLAVKEHHTLAPHALAEHEQMEDDHEPDIVLTLAPEDGQPPLDLNAKLVRTKN